MRRPDVLAVAPWALFSAAALALLAPLALHHFGDAPRPGAAIATMQAHVAWSRALAAIFAVAGILVVGFRFEVAPRAAIRQAAAIAVAGGVVALGFALPVYDHAMLNAVEDRYSADGYSSPDRYSGLHLEGLVSDRFTPIVAYRTESSMVARDMPLRFATPDLHKGDTWYAFAQMGDPNANMTMVALSSGGCDAGAHMDSLGGRAGHFTFDAGFARRGSAVTLQCVAPESGVITGHVAWEPNEPAHPFLTIIVVPTLHATYLTGLDEAFLHLGGWLVLGATLLVATDAWRAAGRERREALAASSLGLGILTLLWGVAARFDVSAERHGRVIPMPLLNNHALLAAIAGGACLAAAWLWWRGRDSPRVRSAAQWGAIGAGATGVFGLIVTLEAGHPGWSFADAGLTLALTLAVGRELWRDAPDAAADDGAADAGAA